MVSLHILRSLKSDFAIFYTSCIFVSMYVCMLMSPYQSCRHKKERHTFQSESIRYIWKKHGIQSIWINLAHMRRILPYTLQYSPFLCLLRSIEYNFFSIFYNVRMCVCGWTLKSIQTAFSINLKFGRYVTSHCRKKL